MEKSCSVVAGGPITGSRLKVPSNATTLIHNGASLPTGSYYASSLEYHAAPKKNE